MSQREQSEQDEFEEEVRTVARALWPSASSGGVQNIDGVEHDGIFVTFETVHCIEATVSRRKEKAEHDGNKLKKAIDRWTGKDDRLAKGWFITKHEPTPDQTMALRKIDRRITAISFRRFKARLIDVYQYDQLRMNMHFGSAANPDDENEELERYIPVEFSSLEDAQQGVTVSFNEALEYISTGGRLAIVGDYGIGKSMNLREIYLRLVAKAKADRDLNVPIHINLRDHWGQKSPSAALTQHAEEIGYGNAQQLIAAWRAGFVHILLDGFDEVAAPGWSGDIASLRSSRRRAVALVRQFIAKTPKRASVVVAGRRHYFDSLQELRDAMFSYHSHMLLELHEFSESQIKEYLKNRNLHNIPAWLPSRPLLLGHLAARNIFSADLQDETMDMSQAEGWDWLLDVISRREADIVEAGLDGVTVRQIIENIASTARNKSLGIGPIAQREIIDAFVLVRGQEPSEAEQAILQRLPGLARDPDFEEGTRSFIDADFASVAQARDVSNFAFSPYSSDEKRLDKWAASLNTLGIEVAAHQYLTMAPNNGHLNNAFKYASRKDLYVVLADLVRIAIDLDHELDETVVVDGVHVPSLSLSQDVPDLSNVVFSNCLFDSIELGDGVDDGMMPHFDKCFIETLLGRHGINDLPSGKFSDDCDFGEFPDAMDRNAAVMASSLPVGVRVILTILRKLYLQRGNGRLEGALSRGMSPEERTLVQAALTLLFRERMATPTRIKTRTIWLPNRANQGRALRFIEAPRGSGDSLYSAASEL
ncbi:NACHT domain-containing protein [Actinomadura verrucosospora]